jgi:hypothetical protein
MSEPKLLPEPDRYGWYRYPDGSEIWESRPGRWAAYRRGQDNSILCFDSPEDAARALAITGEGPPSLASTIPARRIYVASSWRNAHQPGVVQALRERGLEVYDFRNPPPPGQIDGFRWTEIDPDWLRWTPAQWRDAIAHPVAQRGYASDRAGMDWANCGVLVLPCGRSAHLEAGFLAGQGKPVFTLALEPTEPELMTLLLGPPEHLCTSLEELFERLAADPPGQGGGR